MPADKLPCGALARQPFGYVLRRFPGGTHFPCVDYKMGFEQLLKRVKCPTDIDRAMKHVSRSRATCAAFAACYVISSEGSDRSKVGYTTNPVSRLKALSTGLPEKPKVYGLFWSFQQPAGIIEHTVLSKARRDGIRRNGEWLALPGDEAVRYALEAIWGSGVFADSLEFFEQWTGRHVSEMPQEYWTEERNADRSVVKPSAARGFLHL